MKKKIFVTQRVDIVESYGERRDCIDQEVIRFLYFCGYIPVPVNNVPDILDEYLQEIPPSGIVLTGGNDLVKYGGNAPERDITEYKLIDYGIEHRIPIYGFCRGMQILADYFGMKLVHVEHHVGTRHILSGEYEGEEVNSFHNMAIECINAPLQVTAFSPDGRIEAMRHKTEKIYASMWHPERELPYRDQDIKRIKKFLG